MRAGQLDRRIQILDPVESRSGSGEVTVTYQPAAAIQSMSGDAKIWAQVLPVAGMKFFAADQIQSRVTHTVRCRYQPGLRTNQRVRFEIEPGHVVDMDVEAVLQIATDRAHTNLMCMLREAAGWR